MPALHRVVQTLACLAVRIDSQISSLNYRSDSFAFQIKIIGGFRGSQGHVLRMRKNNLTTDYFVDVKCAFSDILYISVALVNSDMGITNFAT